MHKLILAFVGVFLLLSVNISYSQDNNNDDSKEKEKKKDSVLIGFWTYYSNDNEYLVKLDQISSFAMYDYILDGSFRIKEINIVTVGSAICRIIFAEPLGMKEAKGKSSVLDNVLNRSEEIVDKIKDRTKIEKDYWLTPVKTSIPPTTHSHTIDFRVEHEKDLEKIYKHLKKTVKKGSNYGAYIRVNNSKQF